MTDKRDSVKHPRIHPLLRQDAGVLGGVATEPSVTIARARPVADTGAARMTANFKFDRDINQHVVQRSGLYENPATKGVGQTAGDRFQFRAGHVVPEEVAKTFVRVGPWPGETNEEDLEEQETTGRKQAPAPATKVDPAPESK